MSRLPSIFALTLVCGSPWLLRHCLLQARRHAENMCCRRSEAWRSVVDSSSPNHLVSAAMVRAWISHSGIKTRLTRGGYDAVDLTAIEQLIAHNGFVDKTAACNVSRTRGPCILRSASASRCRIYADRRHNAYVTSDGYVFAAHRGRRCFTCLWSPEVTRRPSLRRMWGAYGAAYRPPPARDRRPIAEHQTRQIPRAIPS